MTEEARSTSKNTLNRIRQRHSSHFCYICNKTLKKEYWALAADYKNKQIYWTDYRAEKIGKYDWANNKTSPDLFKGMAHGIENLAVDYVTGNVYWTDSDYKWIMVSDPDCKHYTQVRLL